MGMRKVGTSRPGPRPEGSLSRAGGAWNMGLRRAGGHMLVCVLSQATSLQNSGFRAQIHTLTPLPGPPTNRSHPAGPMLVKGRWT